MPEIANTEKIAQAIVRQMEKAVAGRPKSARVRVGELLNLDKESLFRHLESQSKGTSLEGLKVTFEEVPVILACNDCSWRGLAADENLIFCSSCISTNVDVLAGRDIMVDRIELEQVPN